MFSLNKVLLIGNIGQEPDVKITKDGKKIANFSLATTQSWKIAGSNEWQKKTEWHRICVLNEKLAEICEKFLSKGSKVYIEGQLAQEEWTDKDGIKKNSFKIIIGNYNSSLTLLDSKKDSSPLPKEEEVDAEEDSLDFI